jgi:hypothetical protein
MFSTNPGHANRKMLSFPLPSWRNRRQSRRSAFSRSKRRGPKLPILITFSVHLKVFPYRFQIPRIQDTIGVTAEVIFREERRRECVQLSVERVASAELPKKRVVFCLNECLGGLYSVRMVRNQIRVIPGFE